MPKGRKTPAEPRDIHSADAEEALIGSLIIGGREVYDKVRDIVTDGDFWDKRNSTCFKACENLKIIDQVSLSIEINRLGLLSSVGGVQWLSHCVGTIPTSLHAEYYAQEIKKLSLLRRIMEIGQIIVNKAYNQDAIQTILDEANNMLEGVKQTMMSRHLSITSVTILKSDPPTYKLMVNDKEISMKLETLADSKKFKREIISNLDFVPILPKDWDTYINEVLASAVKSPAPPNASQNSHLKESILDWITENQDAEKYEDLKTGSYVIKNFKGINYYFFRVSALNKALVNKKFFSLTRNELWATFSSWGGTEHPGINVGGKTATQLWGIPKELVDRREASTTTEPEQETLPEPASDKKTMKELPDWF